jgi:hypothetical protein
MKPIAVIAGGKINADQRIRLTVRIGWRRIITARSVRNRTHAAAKLIPDNAADAEANVKRRRRDSVNRAASFFGRTFTGRSLQPRRQRRPVARHPNVRASDSSVPVSVAVADCASALAVEPTTMSVARRKRILRGKFLSDVISRP